MTVNVLSYTNAFPGIPFPQHGNGRAPGVQNYTYPGAVQPLGPVLIAAVLSYTNAFLGIAFAQHGSGKATVQSFLYPGAVQPSIVGPVMSLTQILTLNLVVSISVHS